MCSPYLSWDIHLLLPWDGGTQHAWTLGLRPGLPLSSSPDSWVSELRLNCTTSFAGSPVCREQPVELHNLRNGVSLCVCVFLFLWRSLIHLNTIKNVHSNKRADENCGSIPVPDPSDFHQTLPVNPTPPPLLFFGCPLLEMDHGVSRTPCLENVIRNFNEQGKVLAHVSYTARDGAGQKSI